MTAERWCQTCKGYREIGHEHADGAPTLFDPPKPPNPWENLEPEEPEK